MREHLAPMLYYLEVHLLYASLVCCAAWILTSVPRGSATVKYWIWVAASLNFIVPVAGFIDRFGAQSVPWATELQALGDLGVALSRNAQAAAALLAVWAIGTTLMLTRLLQRIRSEHSGTRESSGACLSKTVRRVCAHGIPVRIARTRASPAVEGVLRTRIVLPEGIDRLLNAHELNAVLLHELTHARRRDNLLRLMHEAVVCGLWFHPLVWLTRSRLALYRELSCDEPVIRSNRGADLISALAKLADPRSESVLRACASSLLSDRLDHLTERLPRRPSLALNSLLTAVFGAVLVGGVIETVAHTACCISVRP